LILSFFNAKLKLKVKQTTQETTQKQEREKHLFPPQGQGKRQKSSFVARCNDPKPLCKDHHGFGVF
jgi:hypothetical protein